MHVSRVELPRLARQHTRRHLDAIAAQEPIASPPHPLVRVFDGAHDALDPGRDDRRRAWRRSAVVNAGFQVDVEGPPSRINTPQRERLGMRATRARVSTTRDYA